jgi:hypothetical protein
MGGDAQASDAQELLKSIEERFRRVIKPVWKEWAKDRILSFWRDKKK